MDKIAKTLKKLSSKERKQIKNILLLIQNNSWQNLDLKKLKGHSNIFRVRKGVLRIIFRQNTKKDIYILAIERRSEKTYRNF